MVKSDVERVNILIGATKHNKDNHTALIIHIEDVEGEVVKREEEKTALPQYDMDVVEDDDSTEEATFAEERTSTEVAKDSSGNSLEENTQSQTAESDNKVRDSENKEEEEKTDSDKTSQRKAVVLTEKKTLVRKINLPKSNSGVSRFILWGILVAIIVGACIVEINYIPSCSGKKRPDNVELRKKENSDQSRNKKRKRAK